MPTMLFNGYILTGYPLSQALLGLWNEELGRDTENMRHPEEVLFKWESFLWKDISSSP